MQKYASDTRTATFQPMEETVGLILARLAKRLAGPSETPAAMRLRKQAMDFERLAQEARIESRQGF